VSNAAALKPTPAQREQLRNEAIASSALTDLRVIKQWPVPAQGSDGFWKFDTWCFDSRLRLYALVADAGGITICQAADDHEVARLPQIGPSVTSIDGFSGDGRFLVACYEDRTNRVWDIARHESVLAIPRENLLLTARGNWWAFTPDNRFLALSRPDGWLSIYAVDTWTETRSVRMLNRLMRFGFLSDGLKVIGIPRDGEHDRVEIVDLSTGTVLDAFVAPNRLWCLAFSGDGHSIAAGSDGGRIYLWNAATGDRLEIDAHQDSVNGLAFNHAGTVLASLSWDGKLRLSDASTGVLMLSAPGEGHQIQFADDDQSLIYADAQHVSLCEIAPIRGLRLLGRASPKPSAFSQAFSPDGRLLATGDEDGIYLWDPATGKELAVVPEETSGALHFHPNGNSLLIRHSQGIHRWPIQAVDGAASACRVGPRTPWITASGILDFALSRNGRFLVGSQMFEPCVPLLFDVENTSAPPIRLPQTHVNSVAISPDGRFVAAGSGISGVKVWDVGNRPSAKRSTNVESGIGNFQPGRTMAGDQWGWESPLRGRFVGVAL
jgi:WD40 repeat protein